MSGRHCKPRRHVTLTAAAVAVSAAALPYLAVPGAAAATVPVDDVPVPVVHLDVTVAHAAPAAGPAFYTVQPGDSLSAIAQHLFGSQAKWPWLYAANERVVGSNPDVIIPGQKLDETLASAPAYGQQSFGGSAPVLAATTVSTSAAPATDGDGDHDGDQSDAADPPAPVQGSYQAPAQQSGSWPGGSFGACVVARESGGNAQVMNSTGHYGLYQFSASTWAAYGGSPGSFGNASVGQQEQVFMNAMAAGGQSNWSPYDGCL